MFLLPFILLHSNGYKNCSLKIAQQKKWPTMNRTANKPCWNHVSMFNAVTKETVPDVDLEGLPAEWGDVNRDERCPSECFWLCGDGGTCRWRLLKAEGLFGHLCSLFLSPWKWSCCFHSPLRRQLLLGPLWPELRCWLTRIDGDPPQCPPPYNSYASCFIFIRCRGLVLFSKTCSAVFSFLIILIIKAFSQDWR